MRSLTLQSPLDGWCAPLAEVPDQVFAEGMVGDGMAIDPVNGVVRSPCDGEIIAVPAGGHAVSIRAMAGVEVLVHVGIDTVSLHGRGFEPLVSVGQRVKAGDELIRFDLDVVARGAKSLMTPIVLAPGAAWRIRRRHAPGRIRTGEMLIDIDVIDAAGAVAQGRGAPARDVAAGAARAVAAEAGQVAAGAAGARAARASGAEVGQVAAGAAGPSAAEVGHVGAGAAAARGAEAGHVGAGDAAHVPASLGVDPQSVTGALSRSVVIPLAHGLHARPAAMLARRARAFEAHVTLSARGKSADARSVTAIMALGVGHGDEVRIVASGAKAAAAIEALLAGINEALSLESPAPPPNPAPLPSSVLPPGPVLPPSPASASSFAGEAPTRTAAAALSTRIAGAVDPASATTLPGIIAVRGFAPGRIARIQRSHIEVIERGKGAEHERAELERARNSVRARLARVGSSGGTARREIAEAHVAFLDDPSLNDTAAESIAAGKSAGFAWRAAIRSAIESLVALDDARLRERADDLLDIESHVLLALSGEARPMNLPLPQEAIVAADDLLPSELVSLDRANLRAIVLGSGGPTSHVAILAAAMDVPMLVGIGTALRDVPTGQRVIVDAEHGVLYAAPDAEELAQAELRAAHLRAKHIADRQAAQAECRTRDGTRIEIFANLGSVAEAEAAVDAGAEGCGLLRTEFLFIDRDSAPREEEQFEIYQGIANALAGRPLILRLMDVGGDKPLPYLPLPAEENPALGLRGVRTALRHPDLLRTQLRAALRLRPSVRILIPMVTDVADVAAVRAIIDEQRSDLGEVTQIDIGAMIETPAAALTADHIAGHVDFFSIGSNDLTQYTLAMDRGHPDLARWIDALHPAVLRLIALTAASGTRHQKLVAVCGGVASDPAAVPLLIGLGVRELSVVPAAIGAIKRQIRSLDVSECAALAERALEARSAVDVRSLVANAKVSPGGSS